MATLNLAQIFSSYRQSDAVLIVCQDNTRKTIEIVAANEAMAHVSGYTSQHLAGQPLAAILPERIRAVVAEMVEYGNDTKDLLAVTSKIRDFAVKSRHGQEIPFRLRITYGEAIDGNPWFHLLFIDEERLGRVQAFRRLLKENFKGHEVIDDYTGLPNRMSLEKDVELTVHAIRSKDFVASFAAMDINQYEELEATYGHDVCNKLYQHIGQACKLKLRAEDTVGSLSGQTLGVILADALQEPARMVLNRLRWVISVTPLPLPKGELTAQVNIGFMQIDNAMEPTDVLEKCESFVVGIRGAVHNSIQLVEVQDRRKQERRKTPQE